MFGSIFKPIDDASDAILHECAAEVDQQAQFHVSQPQISEKLLVMNGCDVFDGLEFEQHFVVDDQIAAKAFVKFEVVVNNRDADLRRNLEPTLSQLVSQHFFVNRLKQTRAKSSMNLKAGIDDRLRNFIFGHENSVLPDD